MKSKLAVAAAAVAVAGATALGAAAASPATAAMAATPTHAGRPVVLRTAHVDFTGNNKKGYELIVGVGDDPGIQSTVYTWRKGRVVKDQAPTQPWDSRSYWNTQSGDCLQVGFHFSTVKGKRYVDAGAVIDTGKNAWKGSVVRSVWTGSSWKKVSVHRVSLTDKQAQLYSFMTGVPIIDR